MSLGDPRTPDQKLYQPIPPCQPPALFLGAVLCLVTAKGSADPLSPALAAWSTSLFPLSPHSALLSSLSERAGDAGIASPFVQRLTWRLPPSRAFIFWEAAYIYRTAVYVFCKQLWEINRSLLGLSNLNNVFFLSVSLIWAVLLYYHIFLVLKFGEIYFLFHRVAPRVFFLRELI